MRPTIKDVSALAQVSIKTVSRVMNKEPNVRPAMRDRVLEAVQVQHGVLQSVGRDATPSVRATRAWNPSPHG